jgi:hypothetical protein
MATVNILPAFTYKWAQDTAGVEALEDTQWRAGWQFIGNVPPSVEQFNKVHQVQDEKANYLYAQMAAVFTKAGIAPAAGTSTTLRDAIAAGSVGRLVRVLRYTRVAGVQNVSTNGGANTTTGAASYVPSANLKFAISEMCGGGGGGAGAVNPAAGQVALGAGGAGGGYCMGYFLPAAIGASQTVVAGAAGIGGAGVNGTTGGTSSLGALMSAGGGGGGITGGSVVVPSLNGQTLASGAVTGGNLQTVQSTAGIPSLAVAANVVSSYGGSGGTNPLSPNSNPIGGNANGQAGIGYGIGGSGVAIFNGAGPASGGDGAAGAVYIYEYE